MDNILDIIYEYSMRKKLLDRKAIEIIITIMIKENNIEIINNINIITHLFDNLSEKTLAYYFNGDINIYLSKIYKYLKKYSDNNLIDNKNLSEFEEYLINNLFILRTVFHELEHSNHERLIHYNNVSIEKELIKIELDFINRINNLYYGDEEKYNRLKKLYDNLYDISFIERLADIWSHEQIIKVLETDKNELKRIYEYEKLLLLNTELSTYKNFNDMPTIRFFIAIGKAKEISKYDLYDLDFKTRLRLGLNLSFDEYFLNQRKLEKKIS